MIRKQVLLDDRMAEMFATLRERCPLASDTVILRAGLLAVYDMEDKDFVAFCEKAVVPLGKPRRDG